MKKWAIVPARIEVKRGQEVELVVSSADVEHGLLIRELGIREPVQPGEPAVIKFRAERSGTFEMRCSVLCGSGHDRMRGQLIVDP